MLWFRRAGQAALADEIVGAKIASATARAALATPTRVRNGAQKLFPGPWVDSWCSAVLSFGKGCSAALRSRLFVVAAGYGVEGIMVVCLM
jgi:hypothetical protein